MILRILISAIFVAAALAKFHPGQSQRDAARWGLRVRDLHLIASLELMAVFGLWIPAVAPLALLALAALLVGAVVMQALGRRWLEVIHPAATLLLLAALWFWPQAKLP